MGTISLVLGGISSGKSAFAESLAARSGRSVLYVATGQPSDAEMEARIEKHRARRPSDWRTLETGSELNSLYQAADEPELAVLLDSVSAWVATLLCEQQENGFETGSDGSHACEARLRDGIGTLINWAQSRSGPLVLVSDEVGFSLVSPNPAGRLFQELLGTTNQLLAAESYEVFLVTAGIPTRIKPAVGSPSLTDRR